MRHVSGIYKRHIFPFLLPSFIVPHPRSRKFTHNGFATTIPLQEKFHFTSSTRCNCIQQHQNHYTLPPQQPHSDYSLKMNAHQSKAIPQDKPPAGKEWRCTFNHSNFHAFSKYELTYCLRKGCLGVFNGYVGEQTEKVQRSVKKKCEHCHGEGMVGPVMAWVAVPVSSRGGPVLWPRLDPSRR
jgi:hypothetical protein